MLEYSKIHKLITENSDKLVEQGYVDRREDKLLARLSIDGIFTLYQLFLYGMNQWKSNLSPYEVAAVDMIQSVLAGVTAAALELRELGKDLPTWEELDAFSQPK